MKLRTPPVRSVAEQARVRLEVGDKNVEVAVLVVVEEVGFVVVVSRTRDLEPTRVRPVSVAVEDDVHRVARRAAPVDPVDVEVVVQVEVTPFLLVVVARSVVAARECTSGDVAERQRAAVLFEPVLEHAHELRPVAVHDVEVEVPVVVGDIDIERSRRDVGLRSVAEQRVHLLRPLAPERGIAVENVAPGELEERRVELFVEPGAVVEVDPRRGVPAEGTPVARVHQVHVPVVVEVAQVAVAGPVDEPVRGDHERRRDGRGDRGPIVHPPS